MTINPLNSLLLNRPHCKQCNKLMQQATRSGYCAKCFGKLERERKAKKWSLKNDCCIECGQTRYKHIGRGLCTSCYHRKKRKNELT